MAGVLLRSEESYIQQLRLWLRPDVEDLLDLDFQVLDEEVIPLLDIDIGLDHAEVDEDRVSRERRDVVERRILHRSSWRAAGRATAAPQGRRVGIRH